MAIELPSAEDFGKMMRRLIREKVDEVIAEETEATTARVRDRVAKMVDRLALEIAGQYDIARNRDGIVITVRKML